MQIGSGFIEAEGTRCLELGLLNEIVPGDQLQDCAVEWARRAEDHRLQAALQLRLADTLDRATGTFLNAMRLSEPGHESRPYRVVTGDVPPPIHQPWRLCHQCIAGSRLPSTLGRAVMPSSAAQVTAMPRKEMRRRFRECGPGAYSFPIDLTRLASVDTVV